jgi:hypothetical protein
MSMADQPCPSSPFVLVRSRTIAEHIEILGDEKIERTMNTGEVCIAVGLIEGLREGVIVGK